MENETKNNIVTHPSHYTDGKIEVIDFIIDKKLGFSLGNAVKYISRAGKKFKDKTLEDLFKACWYVNHKILELAAFQIFSEQDSTYALEAIKGYDNEIEAIEEFKDKLLVLLEENDYIDEKYVNNEDDDTRFSLTGKGMEYANSLSVNK